MVRVTDVSQSCLIYSMIKWIEACDFIDEKSDWHFHRISSTLPNGLSLVQGDQGVVVLFWSDVSGNMTSTRSTPQCPMNPNTASSVVSFSLP